MKHEVDIRRRSSGAYLSQLLHGVVMMVYWSGQKASKHLHFHHHRTVVLL